MCLNTLLLVCLSSDRSIKESKAEIKFSPENGEIILLFDLKNQAISNSIIRKDWGMKNDEPLCDSVIFYSKPSDNKNLFCLVELKGNHISDAVEQIKTTHDYLKKALKSSLGAVHCCHLPAQIQWKAYIRNHGSTPNNTKQLQQKLVDLLGKGNVEISRQNDIGNFLRG